MNTPVVDFHCHVGGWGNRGVTDDPDAYLRIMDAAGVDRACVNCIYYADASIANEYVARYVSAHPDRFVGVAYVTPRYPEEAISQLDHSFGELGMRFLKVHPSFTGVPIDDPSFIAIFEWADKHGIVIMSHSSFSGGDDELARPDAFIGLAERYPKVTWVLAHSGNGRLGQEQAVKAARACPNIYLETATSFGDHGTIEYLVEGAGADRVVFGSDMPLMDARFQIGRIATAAISDGAKRRVLGLNAIELLHLDA